VLPNPWDVGTARLFANVGFRALATTSAGLEFSLGRRRRCGESRGGRTLSTSNRREPPRNSLNTYSLRRQRRLYCWTERLFVQVVSALFLRSLRHTTKRAHGPACSTVQECSGAAQPHLVARGHGASQQQSRSSSHRITPSRTSPNLLLSRFLSLRTKLFARRPKCLRPMLT